MNKAIDNMILALGYYREGDVKKASRYLDTAAKCKDAEEAQEVLSTLNEKALEMSVGGKKDKREKSSVRGRKATSRKARRGRRVESEMDASDDDFSRTDYMDEEDENMETFDDGDLDDEDLDEFEDELSEYEEDDGEVVEVDEEEEEEMEDEDDMEESSTRNFSLSPRARRNIRRLR